LATVAPPCVPLNAPTITSALGTKRNASAYAKNGSVGSQTNEKRLRPDVAPGRRTGSAWACVASD
jgi:hypothetical protein